MRRALFVIAMVLCARAAAAEVTILATGAQADGQTGGYAVYDGQYVGARFHLADPAVITRVGASISGPSGQVFAAIVSVSGPTALPTGSPLNSAEVVWSGLLTLPQTSVDTIVTVNTGLSAGDYLLVIGSGAYGATASGALASATNIGTPSIVWWNSQGWHSSGISGVRLLVYGSPDVYQLIRDDIATRASQTSVDTLTTSVAAVGAGIAAATF